MMMLTFPRFPIKYLFIPGRQDDLVPFFTVALFIDETLDELDASESHSFSDLIFHMGRQHRIVQYL